MGAGTARKLDFHDEASEPEGRTPESFLEEIEKILNAGTLHGAREIAERGLALFPGHPELEQAHYALRPYAKSRAVPGRNAPDQRDSFEWLRRNGSKFRRQWVGLAHGELVAASEILDEVIQAFRLRHLDPRDTLLHFID
jgi:hypothetical protein